MISKAFDLIPLLRAPLLFTSGIGLILSAVAAGVLDQDWHWETAMSNIIDAIVAFYAASLVVTAAFAYTDYRRGGLKLTQGRNLVTTYLVKAGVDLATGIALLTLHILVSVHVASVYGDSVLYMYAGFGALPASVFHAVLATHSVGAALRAWRLSNNYCPTCHQRLRRCDSPDLHGVEAAGEPSVFRNERKGGDSPVANCEGLLEGDRLIVPAGDEV